jgi:PAS domain S-box-containing protein
MASKNGEISGVGNNAHTKSSGKKDTGGLFEQLKELVIFIENELQEKQEELEVQAEELEVQNLELIESNDSLRRAEDASSRLALIVESSDDAIVSNSLDGIIASWNKGAERMFGYSESEMIGKKISMLTPPGHKSEVPGLVGKIKRGEHIEHFETVRRRMDGTLIDVSLSISPIKDRSGNVIGASSIKRDITKQKRAEEERSLLAAIVESSDNAIVSNTLDGIIISWNKGAEIMFGYSGSEVIGKNISILTPPGHKNEVPGIVAKIRRGEHIKCFETVRRRKDGTLIDVSVTLSPIKDRSGIIIGASSIKVDITERKRMEEALQQKQEEIEVQAEELEVQNEELRANNKELKEAKIQSELYLDLMSHDISNMHQIAINNLELAEDIINTRGSLSKDNKEFIDTSLKTLLRSSRLIDEVRKIQKVKAEDYNLETIDIENILLDIIKANSNIPNCEVTFNYNPCFVPGNRYLVKANPLLKDALNNLVDNAIKHNRNPPIIDINVGKEIKNNCAMCMVVIEDNGIGIPDSKKGDLFHRFKRGQTLARGTGLGLYIVKTLVESFYGYVEVEDRVPGDYTNGSRFLVYLPIAED